MKVKKVLDDYARGRAPIVGLTGFKSIIDEYMPIFGPVNYIESRRTISDSGDLAYDIGRHDHVVYEKSGASSKSLDNYIIVLKKVARARFG